MTSHPIKEWLTSISPALAMYADAFEDYGYEDTALLQAVDEGALMKALLDKDTKVKKGHQDAILAAFKVLRASTKHDGAQEEASPSDTLGVAGTQGVLNRYLPKYDKFRFREVKLDGARLDADGQVADAGSLNIIGDSSTETISLDGASLDRCPCFLNASFKPVRKRKVSKVTDVKSNKFLFLVRHGANKEKELLLQANNHDIFCAWTDAIANAGAILEDSGHFATGLCDPKFTLVPIGGSGVGKSTFINLIIGAMWIDSSKSNGSAVGYEDTLFKTSSCVTKSMTTADDVRVVLRQWCDYSDVFKIMDTPGVFDVKGATADTENIGVIVEKLQEEGRVDCFVLVLNAAEPRFSPQQAETIVVFDRILSSESAGSFLDHTVVILNKAARAQFKDEQKTKSDYVRMIQKSLQEYQSRPKDGMAALVEHHNGGKSNMYDDDDLFSRLESRCILFPCFDTLFTHSKAQEALKKLLEHIRQLKGRGSFDCRGVKFARTRVMEMAKQLEAEKAKNIELEEKVKDLEQKQQKLQQLRKSVEEKIRAGEESGHNLTDDDARKVSAQLEVTRKASMYQASNVQGFIDDFRDQAQHVNDTSSRVWLVVSSPEYGSDGEGGYEFETMKEIVALSKQSENVMIGYE
jgi:septin family protein